jgi:hypothetical protein
MYRNHLRMIALLAILIGSGAAAAAAENASDHPALSTDAAVSDSTPLLVTLCPGAAELLGSLSTLPRVSSIDPVNATAPLSRLPATGADPEIRSILGCIECDPQHPNCFLGCSCQCGLDSFACMEACEYGDPLCRFACRNEEEQCSQNCSISCG